MEQGRITEATTGLCVPCGRSGCLKRFHPMWLVIQASLSFSGSIPLALFPFSPLLFYRLSLYSSLLRTIHPLMSGPPSWQTVAGRLFRCFIYFAHTRFICSNSLPYNPLPPPSPSLSFFRCFGQHVFMPDQRTPLKADTNFI